MSLPEKTTPAISLASPSISPRSRSSPSFKSNPCFPAMISPTMHSDPSSPPVAAARKYSSKGASRIFLHAIRHTSNRDRVGYIHAGANRRSGT